MRINKNVIIISILLFALTPILLAQCIPGGSQSEMVANSEEKIDTIFNFDYEIKSTLEYQRNGEVKRDTMTYYVNTQDGSMFFPKGIATANDFETQSEYFRFDGTVWLANRQMVNYVLDKRNNQKRAMTVHSNPLSSDEFINQHIPILTFFYERFYERNEPGVEQLIPELMPASVDWDGITQGFAGYIYVLDTRAKWTVYLDEKPLPSIKTSVPKVGYLVGVLNFFDAEKCNALIVFSKVKSKNSDYYIQEELTYIKPQEKVFNGTAYKPFILLEENTGKSGDNMQNMKAKKIEFQNRMTVLNNQVQQLQKERDQCMQNTKGDPSPCAKKYDPLIKKAEEDVEDLKIEVLKKMRIEDLIKN